VSTEKVKCAVIFRKEAIMLTVDEAKQLLGLKEDQELATELKRSTGAVGNWRADGKVPASIELRISEMIEKPKDGLIPIFHMAGAGPPRLSSGAVVAAVTLPEGFYRLGIVPVKIFGNSMEPVMLDGSIVGVDLHNREYISGKYYAVWLDDQGAVIKKLSSEPGKVFVESLNKNEHSFYINREAIEDHFILGRVIWWINQDTEK
jgi:phage repressor protein C with HTH and peptisase S24 domain